MSYADTFGQERSLPWPEVLVCIRTTGHGVFSTGKYCFPMEMAARSVMLSRRTRHDGPTVLGATNVNSIVRLLQESGYLKQKEQH